MRSYRSYALGAALLSLALLAGACGSGGGGSNATPSGGNTIASTFVFGAPPDCPPNPFCQIGLRKTYGIVFKEVKKLDFGGPLTVNALKSGAVQVGELFSSSVYDPDFVVLQDDKHLEQADNLVPIIRKAVDSPDIDAILNSVMAKLTTPILIGLNKQYDVDHQDPASIAQAFIQQYSLEGPKTNRGAGKTLVIGDSFSGNEQLILDNACKILLENAGYTVKLKDNIESRKIGDTALFKGEIDIKIEYVGSEAKQNDPTAKTNGDPSNNLTILRGIMDAKGVNVLNFSPATDENVFVVTKATATKYHLSKLSDLAKPAP
ncbi:MAG TPA: glycine betaine ABC transporter substrate-binding protein [Actinomycetota bacterium]